MNLEGLLEVGEIERLKCSLSEIDGLLRKAKRKLNDSRAENISNETRLEQAYTVAFTCATIGLRAMDYRIINNAAKHYLTIETTRYTFGLDDETIEYWQTIRNMRNQDIYGIALQINDNDLRTLIEDAGKLLEMTKSWLKNNHTELFT